MKRLDIYLTDQDPEWEDQLNKTLIDPIESLGYRFRGYGSYYDEGTSSGTHTLLFKHTLSDHIDLNAKIKNILQDADNQSVEDDQQPPILYSDHLGTLFIYIPFNT